MEREEKDSTWRDMEAPLTAVLLVAVVGTVVVVVAPPQGRDAASVVALKLSGFAL